MGTIVEQCAGLIARVREKKPLLHHITNYVTVNECANITLAIGASPVMADDVRDAVDIADIAGGLVINMGTLNERTVQSMLAAGRRASERGIPVIFDPVGVGASGYRNEAATAILDTVKLTALRGNISEIRFLAGQSSGAKGVDASDADVAAGQGDARQTASALARRYGCVVAITGAMDVVSDGARCLEIINGHPMLSCLTGTGCMCTSLVGSLLAAAPDDPLHATASALLAMGIAGEIAYEKAGHLGNGSFRTALLDAVSRMDGETIVGRAKIHEA